MNDPLDTTDSAPAVLDIVKLLLADYDIYY